MPEEDQKPSSRRETLATAAQALVAVGGVAALWPVFSQMGPNRATPPPETTFVDLSAIAPGRSITVAWRGQPVEVRHRTPIEIEHARRTPVQAFRDQLARNANLPGDSLATDDNRRAPHYPQWMIVVTLCTHLGCRLSPRGPNAEHAADPTWLCPCHASRFDAAGRVLDGPAQANLPVPPYRLLSPSRLEIGVA